MALTSTSFTKGHKHSAKPRKRTTLSESALRSALIRKGEVALFFYEELFEIKELEDGSKDYALKERNGEKIKLTDRINAANAWSKLVFIQPKGEENIEQNQLVMSNMNEVASYLIEKGHPVDVLKDLLDGMKLAAVKQREALENEQNSDAE